MVLHSKFYILNSIFSPMSLPSQLSSLLFISPKPISLDKLAELTQSPAAEVKAVLADLQKQYSAQGLSILQVGKSYQMTTAPEMAGLVKEFIQDEQTGELTRPALETLAIVAYRGPVTRAEIEQIRGVNCAVILRNLLIRGLVEAADDEAKLATVYSITFDFLKLLGVARVEELPQYEKLNSEENLQQLLAGQVEAVAVIAMGAGAQKNAADDLQEEAVEVVEKKEADSGEREGASAEVDDGEDEEDEYDEDEDEEDGEDEEGEEVIKKAPGIILSVEDDDEEDEDAEMEKAGFHTEEEEE